MTPPAELSRRFLVLIDEEHAGYVEQVFRGRAWARVIDLLSEEVPVPAGKRVVCDAAWEVLRQGARIPIGSIQSSMEMMGTRSLSNDQRMNSEKWCVAELERRDVDDTDYDE